MTSPPPWRYVPADGQLHMIRREALGVAEALCPLRVPVAELREPGGEDQPRCSVCVGVYEPAIAGRVAAPVRPLTRLAGYVTGVRPAGAPPELADGFGRRSRCEPVVLDELPVDARGEIDRRRLPPRGGSH